MNKVFFWICIFLFSSGQLLASACKVSCSDQESTKYSKKNSHQCCPDKEQKENKDRNKLCYPDMSSHLCSHDVETLQQPLGEIDHSQQYQGIFLYFTYVLPPPQITILYKNQKRKFLHIESRQNILISQEKLLI